VLQLTPIIGGIELALGGGDESIGSNLPTLEAADANPMPGPSRPGVGADQRPVYSAPRNLAMWSGQSALGPYRIKLE
jgi:hypothetical protein